jgi:serine-type D-Ala-D-Ala carboxypeptidase/endopeptidase (penicillin-binding protein 4)
MRPVCVVHLVLVAAPGGDLDGDVEGAAALSRLGGDATFTTRVVTGVAPDEVVLLGGGDVLLAPGAGDPAAANGHAGLDDLAEATATALRSQGRTAVAVRVDDSLFSGPSMGAGWTQSDLALGFAAPVTALAVNAGRVEDERYAPRVADPSLAAGETFAGLLRAEGVAVAGDVARTVAPAEPEVLAEVSSAPVADVVGYVLAASDNTAAEAMARMVAVEMGRPAAFADAARAVLDEVALLGVDVSGVTLADGSGLSDGSSMPAQVLTGLLATAASGEHPELRPLLTGLPVAGLDGTLLDRFTDDGAVAGLGAVRAKTGSLTGVTSLAGTVLTVDGRLLVFAVLADAVPATGPAREAVDSMAAVLAGCGCR